MPWPNVLAILAGSLAAGLGTYQALGPLEAWIVALGNRKVVRK